MTITRDLVLTVLLSTALAAWITDHVALAVGLLRRKPRWRGLVAFLIAPLAPVFGFMTKLRVRSILWVVFAVAYGVLRWKAYA